MMLLKIKSNPKTKQLMREYWKGTMDTRRLDNPMYYPKAVELIQKLFEASLKQQARENKHTLWNPVGSYPSIYRKLFPNYYRKGGEYSWSYSFVVDFAKEDGATKQSVQILIITEDGRGTSLEYLNGDSKLIIDFLQYIKQAVEACLAAGDKP